MIPVFRRAAARLLSGALPLALLPFTLGAQPAADVALKLPEAANLAVSAQPLLQGLEAQTRAARETAVAARQLPDPQLFTGIADLPVNTDDAYSLTRDGDTQIVVGLMQEFPRAQKRRLRGELSEREAARLDAEHDLARRAIRRDASLAWLELWRYDQLLSLARASLREAEAQTQAVEIALKTGTTATQAEFLAARQEADRRRDEVAAAEQSVAHARNALSRWIGEAAWRPVSPQLPETPTLPSLAATLDRVRAHPQLAGASAQVAAAQTGAALAQAAFKPDWRVELGYGYRPAFSEMLMLQVGVDLPVFTRNRQDRGLAAALAQRDAAEFAVEDASRQLVAEARLNHHDYERLTIRLQDYEQTLLPQSRNRITAALAGWRSGRNALREVLDARRAALEIQMARFDLQHDLARHFVQLTYLGAFETDAGEDPHE
ncbi:MAG: TolC family protein [Sinimarinibacterium flocculans]|uniref:TolC family protein n=1 Tax=Sinimarinibacterium flocculans TaxID=985250 RepID=UPI002493B243|nr:TolC family protein [Sinimarinibacterium flocculans]MEC9357477.1 TolC family protein [Pseudomonadota bacterium]